MRTFSCPVCATQVYFENTYCGACGTAIGYDAAANAFAAIGMAKAGGINYCANHLDSGCNWVVPESATSPFCLACDLNEMIPPIADPEQRRRWADVEAAKRRFVYSVLRLNIPIYPKRHDATGLSFRILVNAEHGGTGDVVMGHANGVITIDATEADAHLREFRRGRLDERYRTLLGHMRHESGHYFWERLSLIDGFLDGFRALFGDERADYGAALEDYYRDGPPADWMENHISAYATAHPWEDWAESFAHYLHVVDGVETAETFGAHFFAAGDPVDPYDAEDFTATAKRWHPVAITMNAMNRSMGHHDFYPFVLNAAVDAKLAFIHRWLIELRPAAERKPGGKIAGQVY